MKDGTTVSDIGKRGLLKNLRIGVTKRTERDKNVRIIRFTYTNIVIASGL